VTCHDGFTLHDLVSYERKHNEANGEDNRDGSDANWSRNWGVEGPTESVRIRHHRERVKRNLIATLALSQGVPMLSHGDELGRTQRGNNNAYCHDGPLTWVDWELAPEQRDLLAFVQRALEIRRRNPVVRRRGFFSGRPLAGGRAKDVSWFRRDAKEMTEQDWRDPELRDLGMLIHGEASDEVDEFGRPVQGDTLLLLVNGSARSRYFRLPPMPSAGYWEETLNTARPSAAPRPLRRDAATLVADSLILLTYRAAR
jgi:glycogen operon protein